MRNIRHQQQDTIGCVVNMWYSTGAPGAITIYPGTKPVYAAPTPRSPVHRTLILIPSRIRESSLHQQLRTTCFTDSSKSNATTILPHRALSKVASSPI
ncbi:hypothetical protein J6590_107595, partial [Homalodisca vitripennis]